MTIKPLEWASDHPLIVGAGVFGVGLVVILVMTNGRGVQAAPASSGQSVMVGNVGPDTQLAAIGTQFQMAQLQASTSANIANTQAAVEQSRIVQSGQLGAKYLDVQGATALAQISSDTFLGSKVLDLKGQKQAYDLTLGLDSNNVSREKMNYDYNYGVIALNAGTTVALDNNRTILGLSSDNLVLSSDNNFTKRAISADANQLVRDVTASSERLTYNRDQNDYSLGVQSLNSSERLAFNAQTIFNTLEGAKIDAGRDATARGAILAQDVNEKNYGLALAGYMTQAQIAQSNAGIVGAQIAAQSHAVDANASSTDLKSIMPLLATAAMVLL